MVTWWLATYGPTAIQDVPQLRRVNIVMSDIAAYILYLIIIGFYIKSIFFKSRLIETIKNEEEFNKQN